MISIKNTYKPKNLKPMPIDFKKQLQTNINILKYVLAGSDMYGCDIMIRAKNIQSDWISISDEQVHQLIESYNQRLEKFGKYDI